MSFMCIYINILIFIENILICDPVNVGHVKLIDFGLSCLFDDYFVTVFTQKCGTLYYMAPELIKGQLYSKVRFIRNLYFLEIMC